MRARTFVPVSLAWLLTLSATLAAAQPQQSRLMGLVTDGSGGSLPGVTVTVRSGSTAATSVVSDATGRYLTAWIAPGTYTVTFVLSGFETRTVSNIPLGAGETVVLDQQLPIASVSETVEVVAEAPKPPPPLPEPSKPRVVRRPEPRPVDKETLASVCGPRQATDFTLAIGKILSHRDDPNRQLLGTGDVLRIDAGEKQGLATGQNFVVRRRFQTGDRSAPKKLATYGEQTAGLIQILETSAESSSALVVYLCGELYAGDTVEPLVAHRAYFAIPEGAPQFDDPARIVTGEDGKTASSGGQMMVIDRGILKGLQRGQRATIFRRVAGSGLPPLTIGDGVIIAVRADSATLRIDRATDAVMVGDMVALHR
jgi:hypothetical protein